MMEIHIRRAAKDDIPGIAKVHVDSWKTTYKGIFAEGILGKITYEQREKQWETIFQQEHKYQYRFVAETLDGTIIGFIDGGVERSGAYNCDGELYAIYLLQEYQGMKIGQKLFQALLSECINDNMQSLLVWVVTNNPSKKFYKKFNPEKIDTKFLERVQVEETAYCWRDINNIIM
ncbi:GNAT family N-acetyltransferase [Bacillus sp. AFS094611]|uniref:GNAT family N-acetyltransferase n=2 Tax=Bacillaceae TaxID=186817 RepID=A0A9Q5X444_BACTU|nr:GNAT family N-acetyltransferase [Bacillus thuringiensis serovar coreanensis]OTX49155.1 GNAT family N-acetyltransferase [Bacillus thuringiensis serovar sooncheon]OTX57668.1 GNAT family N-acetyltransferase [Bacillus thuringiensis serovar guiyangiensis]OTX62677.1 GNAT family N-acetyltransferase [Bacillus thuringiensis serovar roskildiensis]PDZ51795.1 GNAT family N-acetyltransferase [Bacillus sp. AFS094611]